MARVFPIGMMLFKLIAVLSLIYNESPCIQKFEKNKSIETELNLNKSSSTFKTSNTLNFKL